MVFRVKSCHQLQELADAVLLLFDRMAQRPFSIGFVVVASTDLRAYYVAPLTRLAMIAWAARWDAGRFR